jgi:tRNA uridine 5-carbamoylmethylation protein Kti12
MEDLKRLYDLEFLNYKFKMPSKTNTIDSLSKRLEWFEENASNFEKSTNDIANKYIKDKNIKSEEDLMEVKQIAENFLKKFAELLK